MSTSMVRQSLTIVDPDFGTSKGKLKKSIRALIPENQKIIEKVNRKGKKHKVDVLKTSLKLTVSDAKKINKSREQTLKQNLEKLKLIQQACTIDLDEDLTKQLIERAVTKRPVKTNKPKKVQKTAFTEEDFQKFEKEYFVEN